MAEIIADSPVAEALAEALAEEEFADVTCVCIEHRRDGARHSDLPGLKDAFDAATTGSPVVMLGWLPVTQYAVRPIWHAILAHPQVRFLRMPVFADQIRLEFRTARGDLREIDRLAIRLYEIGEINAGVGGVQHNLAHARRGGAEALATWAPSARQIFGDLPLDELIEAVEKATLETYPARMSGERFPDLCVDAEGTLLSVHGGIDAMIRGEVVSAERSGYPVTVWTGGDVKEIRKKLLAEGITWKVASKWLFRGVDVRAALDDEPLEILSQKYGFWVEQFTQVR